MAPKVAKASTVLVAADGIFDRHFDKQPKEVFTQAIMQYIYSMWMLLISTVT
jgi:hypothetical protein